MAPQWLQRGWPAALVAAMIAGATGAAHAEQCGFCSIPAARASNGAPIELRLSIKNDTPADRTYEVDFYAEEGGRCTKITPAPISKRVETGKCGLYATAWTPTGCYGQYALRYVAQDRASGSRVASGTSALTIVDSGGRYRSPATATAAWIEPGALAGNFTNTRGQLIDRIHEMHALGMDLIIVAYVEDVAWGSGAYYPSRIPQLAHEVHYDDPRFQGDARYHVLETILEAAKANGQKVVLGLGRGPGPPELPEWITTDEHRSTHWRFFEQVVAELWAQYGREGSVHDYADTIWGWFLSWECGTLDTNAWRFYEGCCATLRAIDPAKPILMSPCPVYNLGFPPFPAVYPDGTTWASNLARSDIDVFIYQDGASCGFDFDGATPNDCRATWHSWEAIRDNTRFEMANIAARHAGTGKHFWSMMEMWRQDATGKQWAGTWDECSQQIDSARQHASQIVFNEYLAYMASPENPWSWMKPGSSELYQGYQAWYQRNQLK